MEEPTYVAFYEHNDWEGETWRFWLQKDGNEKYLEYLSSLIEDNESYELKLAQELPESAVDVLVANSAQGYLYYDNKVNGVLDLGSVTAEDDDLFYKGGIARFFNE